MSKEMKMADYFPEAFAVPHNKSFEVQNCFWVTFGEEYESKIKQDDAIAHAVLNHDRLVEENAALREALRLEESECDALRSEVDRLCEIINELGDGDENQQAD